MKGIHGYCGRKTGSNRCSSTFMKSCKFTKTIDITTTVDKMCKYVMITNNIVQIKSCRQKLSETLEHRQRYTEH